ncbi:MAG: PEP-CTERM sorting domain-containing protein [Proteobacteria bacterium]|nr:PEP-CTERM sorting domain-containing protein [Pseudomonadota bacterium]
MATRIPTRAMRFFGAVAAAAVFSQGVSAGAIEWIAGTDGWYDPTNWDLGRLPEPLGGGGAGDSAFITNGGTATADVSSGAVDIRARDILVGAQNSTAPKSGAIAGSLEINGVNVEGQFRVDVGVASGAVTDAEGSVSVTNGSVIAGQSVFVGSVNTTEAPASAVGSLNVEGGGVTAAASLLVGTVSVNTFAGTFSQDATASGIATVDGDVEGGLSVGTNSGGDSTSMATGTLTITNGALNLENPGATIGSASLAFNAAEGGTSIGSVTVETGQLRITDSTFNLDLNVGVASGAATNATGELTVGGGLDLGTEAFREVNIGSAVLDGTAQGSVTSPAGDLRVTNDVNVGTAMGGFDAARGAGSGTGTLDLGTGNVTGVDGIAGTFALGSISNAGLFSTGEGIALGNAMTNGLSGFDNYLVGVNRGTRHSADSEARGALTVGNGGIVGNADGDSVLIIGASLGTPNNSQVFGPGGTAEGTASVAGGGVTGFNQIAVGASGTTGTTTGMGTAIGSLTVSGGDVSTASLWVGQAYLVNNSQVANAEAAPVADGHFAMTGGELAVESSFYVGNALTLGSGATVVNPNPVSATGRAVLTDVVVTGNASVRVGAATSAFEDRLASATGELNVLRGAMSVGNVSIGVAGEGDVGRGTVNLTDTSLAASESITIAGGGDSQGRLNAVNSDISAGEDMFISGFRSAIGTDDVPEARGILDMQGGNLDVAGTLRVASQFQGSEGEMHLTGVQANVGESFLVGGSSNLGALFGNGVDELNNSSLAVGGFGFVDAGSLQLIDSSMSVADYLVTEFYNPTSGEYFDGASGDSVIGLTRSLLDIGGEFGHGMDDFLQFSLDGIDRGITYGAINARNVNLRGGHLAIDINFGLTAQEYAFDLILSTGMDEIIGDFASVALTGLDPFYNFTSGVVRDDSGPGLVEVYRLAVTRRGVPEPASVALLLLGLLGVIVQRSSRRG